ncbi:hypothetical protein D3C87_1598360 [compost metagenome]
MCSKKLPRPSGAAILLSADGRLNIQLKIFVQMLIQFLGYLSHQIACQCNFSFHGLKVPGVHLGVFALKFEWHGVKHRSQLRCDFAQRISSELDRYQLPFRDFIFSFLSHGLRRRQPDFLLQQQVIKR